MISQVAGRCFSAWAIERNTQFITVNSEFTACRTSLRVVNLHPKVSKMNKRAAFEEWVTNFDLSVAPPVRR